jgi:hypothetical protein
MRQWSAVAVTRPVRVVRGLWPDRDPLRRGLDRAEAAIMAGLAVVFLAAVRQGGWSWPAPWME